MTSDSSPRGSAKGSLAIPPTPSGSFEIGAVCGVNSGSLPGSGVNSASLSRGVSPPASCESVSSSSTASMATISSSSSTSRSSSVDGLWFSTTVSFARAFSSFSCSAAVLTSATSFLAWYLVRCPFITNLLAIISGVTLLPRSANC